MNFDTLFQDFADVSIFVIARLRTIFMSFYNTSRFGFLFNMAILPVILFLAFDIVFSFVLSVKFKRLVIFNVISPRSWSFLSLKSYNNRLKPCHGSVKYTAPSSFTKKLRLKYKTIQNTSSLKGKIFHKQYTDWKEFMPKTLANMNVVLRSINNTLDSINSRKNNKSNDSSDTSESASDD